MIKTVDLSCLIGQQVLCELSHWEDFDHPSVGFLTNIMTINNSTKYFIDRLHSLSFCRIYQHPEYWISNHDGKLVLPDGLMVQGMLDTTKINGFIKNGGFSPSHQKRRHELLKYTLPLKSFSAFLIDGVADGWSY